MSTRLEFPSIGLSLVIVSSDHDPTELRFNEWYQMIFEKRLQKVGRKNPNHLPFLCICSLLTPQMMELRIK